MNLQDATDIISEYNIWRRGNLKLLRFTPKEIGIALEVMIEHCKKELK